MTTSIRKQITKVGTVLTDMVMPNIAAFIACGLLAAVCAPHGWWPNADIYRVVSLSQAYLIPMLLAFTGGSNVGGHRGGVVAAITAMGVISTAQSAAILGAMIAGPVAGWAVNAVDDWLRPHVKQGFEMLVNNFSAGILGILLALASYYGLAPVVDAGASLLASGVANLIAWHLLPLANVIIEPAKVLFLNNALNHGILTPLGMQAADQVGKSVLFLVETNPGPGLGILLAFHYFGHGHSQKSAGNAAIIEFFGGIHEIYFPYVLSQPALLLAAIAGGVAGTFTFSSLDAGLTTVASPGSIISILLLTPHGLGSFLAVVAGVLAAAVISFGVASVVLKYSHQPASDVEVIQPSKHAIRKIIITGTQGMGTPQMAVTLLQAKLKNLNDITVSVVAQPISELTPDQNALFITRDDLVSVVHDQVPGEIRILAVTNYLKSPVYDQVLAMLQAQKQ
ncbi:PTS mannitol transporter subunit IICB [Lacticaseibacillus porcinae]|uniref:PTS mannitol transporter subunit IICB n=1 Tax=Lacticaseibacillus porcinae TaxID=1123687 RepID=UPI000F78F98E|nr:PTS mannitol transporter subunit IICB [Lacticaseibacillus porcinae]